MERRELFALIDSGESQWLDFKKTVTHKHKIAKTLVSFANTHGGKLLIGVMDDHQIIGVDPEEERFSLLEAAKHFCQPPVTVEFSEVEDKYGNIVLVVDVPESSDKPHCAVDQQGKWQAYIRSSDKTLLASKAVLKSIDLIGEKKNAYTLSKQQQALVEYLKVHERTTVKQFAKLLNLSDRRAKRMIVEMQQNGWLFQHELEKEAYYTLA